ncbi:MAG TPA: hypothetical protein VGQ76_10455 [Thermoanaerobaculia bacterium]|jgi:hypothetical protein|nr:hypothetical protein [Thermoanaerobaculia bacterium]
MAIQNTYLNDLYAELHALCGNNCGLLLTQEVFKAALTKGLANLETGQTLAVKSIPEVSFTSVIPASAPDIRLRPVGGAVHAIIGGITMNVDFHATGTPADVLSTITFDVVRIEARLEIDNGRIVARRVDYQVEPTITPGANREAVVVALGWDATDIETFERLENFTLFATPAVVADQVLGNVAGMPLQQWLIGLKLQDPMTIEHFDQAQSGPCVLIRSLTGSNFTREGECPCADLVAPEVEGVEDGALRIAVKQTPRSNAPTGEDVPNEQHFSESYAYLYTPQAILASTFAPSIYPAAYISGGGSWGPPQYSWSGVLAFRRVVPRIDVGSASIVINADLALHISARAWLDLPCDGEQELATANVDGEINNVRIRVKFVVDRATGRLVLDSALENHDVTDVNVSLGGIFNRLWPLNQILASVVKHNVPGLITRALRSAVASGRFALLDLNPLLVRLNAVVNGQSTFADATGFVVGIGQRG